MVPTFVAPVTTLTAPPTQVQEALTERGGGTGLEPPLFRSSPPPIPPLPPPPLARALRCALFALGGAASWQAGEMLAPQRCNRPSAPW
eukprot:gene13810-biopygen3547